MQITRRNFLQTCGAVAAVGLTCGELRTFGQSKNNELIPIPPEAYSDPFYSLSAKQCELLIGTSFTATSIDGEVFRLVLSEVNPFDVQINNINGYYGESFSLVFEGNERRKLRQGIYEIEGGGFVLSSALIVPTDRLQKRYEVVVNHLTR